MIKKILLDLDGTLYPSTNAMEAEVVSRMNGFTAEFLGIPIEEAKELRRTRMPKYGTTLEWLSKVHGFEDTEKYLAYIHPDGEEECIDPDPALAEFLRSLDYPCAVLTNAPGEHAERVIRKLGIDGIFVKIYDIRFNKLLGKPHRTAFERVLADFEADASETLFVDDIPRYVEGYTAIGGKGVLIDITGKHAGTSLETIATLYEMTKYFNGRNSE